MGSQRQSWANPAGKWISLICLGVAVLAGALAVLSAVGVFGWSLEDGEAVSHWWGTSVLVVIFLALGGFAFRPTWSITAGTRGIGVRKLWRNVFIRYDEFRSADLDSTGEPPRIRIVTRKSAMRIFPRISDPEGLAQHLDTMNRKSQA